MIKAGDKVEYKDDPGVIYTVYAVYSKSMVSLGLLDYPEIEQDYQVNINELRKVKNNDSN